MPRNASMIRFTRRTLASAVVAMATACTPEHRDSAATPAATGSAYSEARGATTGVTVAGATGGDSLTDEEYARALAKYGLVVRLDDATGVMEAGSFYPVELIDTTRTLAELGFVRAVTLLDTATHLESYGESTSTHPLQVASAPATDSAFHAQSECALAIPIHFRRAGDETDGWTFALVPGAGEVVAANLARRTGWSEADTQLAVRLAGEIELTSAERMHADGEDATFAELPARVRTLERTTIEGIEYVFADVRRARGLSGDSDLVLDEPQEQRVVVAERDTRDPGASFRVVWHHYEVANPDNASIEVPRMLLRLGRERLLTLYVVGDYTDGIGGTFIGRVNGRWRALARWYGGC